MEEENESIDLYNDLDWDTVIEEAYKTLTTFAVDFLPTQETVDLMVSVIDEAKTSGPGLPVPSVRNARTVQSLILGRVSSIINDRVDSLAPDATEYKMFSDIRALIFSLVARPDSFEFFLAAMLGSHAQQHC